MKRIVKRKLVIKNCSHDFGLGPGVLTTDEVVFKAGDNKDITNSRIAARLLYMNQKMIEDNIEVICSVIQY